MLKAARLALCVALACALAEGVAVFAQTEEAKGPKPSALTPLTAADLPKAVSDAVMAAFPNATIWLAYHNEKAHKWFVTVKDGDKKPCLSVMESGLVVEIETALPVAELSQLVANAALTAVPGARITNATKCEAIADQRTGAKLHRPITYYVRLVKNNMAGAFYITEQGMVLGDPNMRPVIKRAPTSAPTVN